MIRYATLYFTLLIVFVGMIAGPVAYSNAVKQPSFLSKIKAGNFILVQPNNQNNNDTSGEKTGFAATGSASLPTTTAPA